MIRKYVLSYPRRRPDDFFTCVLGIPSNMSFSSVSVGSKVDIQNSAFTLDATPIFGTISNGSSSAYKPAEIVDQLNKYIVGQHDAKRAVSIAMRNRWRRQKLSEEMRNEVIPKNILMIGPTGCGKTEIARRIAKLSQAPFVKVEATKYTEVGFHGKDVDQIISDLMEISIAMMKKKNGEKHRAAARAQAETTLLELLSSQQGKEYTMEELQSGNLNDLYVVINMPIERDNQPVVQQEISKVFVTLGFMRPEGADKQTEKTRLKVSEAIQFLEEEAVSKMVSTTDVVKDAILAVEQNGIVFIDELDKICHPSDYSGRDASAEGVQRDLLPLIEGSSVSTKYGNINTDFILFIGSGAFHQCKPSDLLAELQGRLPIRVELKGLTEDDLYRILTEPVTNLIMQQQALLLAEGTILKFEDSAIREIARVAELTNKTLENIGARRLHTILERVVEDISYDAANNIPGTVITVTTELVQSRVSDLLIRSDLSKYIL